MQKTQLKYMQDFSTQSEPIYFHLAHFLNIRNRQIIHLNELQKTGYIKLKKVKTLLVAVKITDLGKEFIKSQNI